MFQIPWSSYSEEEIQDILEFLFKRKGYSVYNAHKVDRRGEEGVDLECARTAESDRIIVAVKKKPQQKDLGQLETLRSKTLKTKIYVYVEDPSAAFKNHMVEAVSEVSFWNSQKLTSELFNVSPELYLWLVIENLSQQDFYDMASAFCKIYNELMDRKTKLARLAKPDSRMLTLLWQGKDRAASLYKSLETLQTVFEVTKPTTISDEGRQDLVDAFLRGVLHVCGGSLKPLNRIFKEFLRNYRENFEMICEQTKDRSSWDYFSENSHSPYAPGHIAETLQKDAGVEADSLSEEHDLPRILGNTSRTLAIRGYWLEEMVNHLMSLALFGDWARMNRMSPELSRDDLMTWFRPANEP